MKVGGGGEQEQEQKRRTVYYAAERNMIASSMNAHAQQMRFATFQTDFFSLCPLQGRVAAEAERACLKRLFFFIVKRLSVHSENSGTVHQVCKRLEKRKNVEKKYQ